MPRKGPVPKREMIPDPVYNSTLVTRLMNRLMIDGKKGKAQRIFYKSMERIQERTEKDPLVVLEQALANVVPVLEVKARRVGGANYQVPIEVKPERRVSLALPGRMGGKRVTAMSLRIVGIDEEKNLILVYGSVPGPRRGYVIIRSAALDWAARSTAK